MSTPDFFLYMQLQLSFLETSIPTLLFKPSKSPTSQVLGRLTHCGLFLYPTLQPPHHTLFLFIKQSHHLWNFCYHCLSFQCSYDWQIHIYLLHCIILLHILSFYYHPIQWRFTFFGRFTSHHFSRWYPVESSWFIITITHLLPTQLSCLLSLCYVPLDKSEPCLKPTISLIYASL